MYSSSAGCNVFLHVQVLTRSMREILAEAALENGMEADISGMDFGDMDGVNQGDNDDSDDDSVDISEECEDGAVSKMRRAVIHA